MTTVRDVIKLEERISLLENRVKKLEGVPEQKPKFEDVVALVQKMRRVSTSLLQRKLNIGYARAARLIDELEGKGYIGPHKGLRMRDVIRKAG